MYSKSLPVVSIVVPFWGYLLGSLIIHLVKPKKRNYNGDHRYTSIGLKAVPKERHLGTRVYTLCVTWALRVGPGLQVSDGSWGKPRV